MKEILHYNLDDEPECFGEMYAENVFKDGKLVNRFWHCSECGWEITEEELVQIERSKEDEKSDWYDFC